ncbi:circularly permuted type 2 ATP-grasp protein [Sphingomonas sp. MMS24-JH45]
MCSRAGAAPRRRHRHRLPRRGRGERASRACSRPSPLSAPVDEWDRIARGVVQRADLLETIAKDIYVARRRWSAAATSRRRWLPAVPSSAPAGGVAPPAGTSSISSPSTSAWSAREWRVLSDHLRMPSGAGYAPQNRLASANAGGTAAPADPRRHAPFFAAFRDGLAASCHRADPRIGLLTPGRATIPAMPNRRISRRHLGPPLVEGDDLAVRDDRLYVRTIGGLSGLMARSAPGSSPAAHRLGVRHPLAHRGDRLIDARAESNVVIANAPGVGVLESPAFAAFLPQLATRLTGADLILPTIATWWCGQPTEAEHVRTDLASMLGPAFGTATLGLARATSGADLDAEARAAFLADMDRRPQDYVGQADSPPASTMPAPPRDRLEPRPFTLLVFAARDGNGRWQVLPGGFAHRRACR